jgi:hypothetical protein
MLVEEKFDAFMLETIVSIIDNKTLNPSCQLINFSKKPLLSGFGDFGNC